MLDLICPIRLPHWYEIVRDFAPVLASIIALGAAYAAFRGVKAKIDADRTDRSNDRMHAAEALNLELRYRARPLADIVQTIVTWKATNEIDSAVRNTANLGTTIHMAKETTKQAWQSLGAVHQAKRSILAQKIAAFDVATRVASVLQMMLEAALGESQSIRPEVMYAAAYAINKHVHEIDAALGIDLKEVARIDLWQQCAAAFPNPGDVKNTPTSNGNP
jgi:hypothetical protein